MKVLVLWFVLVIGLVLSGCNQENTVESMIEEACPNGCATAVVLTDTTYEPYSYGRHDEKCDWPSTTQNLPAGTIVRVSDVQVSLTHGDWAFGYIDLATGTAVGWIRLDDLGNWNPSRPQPDLVNTCSLP